MTDHFQQELAKFQERLNIVLTNLAISDSSPTLERDLYILSLLMNAADYAALACDLSMTSSYLAQEENTFLLAPASTDGAVEGLVLVGIAVQNTDSSADSKEFGKPEQLLPPLQKEAKRRHHGGCISPDPSELFPEEDEQCEPQAKDKQEADNDEESQAAQEMLSEQGTNKFQAVTEHFVPSSSSPSKGAEEVAHELLGRAEQLLTRAEQLRTQM